MQNCRAAEECLLIWKHLPDKNEYRRIYGQRLPKATRFEAYISNSSFPTVRFQQEEVESAILQMPSPVRPR